MLRGNLMSFYKNLYDKICNKGILHLTEWLNDNNSKIHRHHIIPKHMGGVDDDSNYTYLSIREHYIAHWLLWKINGNYEDLCASYLLQNKENKTSDIRKIWASLGGKTSGIKQKEMGINIHCSKSNPLLHKEWASLGGKSHKGKKQMYKPGDKTFIRVSPNDWSKYIEMGFVFGTPLKLNKGKKFGPSKRRKAVTDGKKIYDSIHSAAKECKITPGAVIYRIKSPHNAWAYISDNESLL